MDRAGRKEAALKRASRGLGLLLTSSLLALGLVALSLLGALPFLPLPGWLQALLLVLVGAGIVGGSRAVKPLPVPIPAGPEAPATAGDPADDDADETRGLLAGLSRTLASIEQQAADVDRFARRLDAAYSELEFANARLKEFSFKDDVTGLYNRRFFTIRLEEEVSRYRRFNHPVSVVLLDLDGFKAINDDLGHAAGDETLRDMAEILMRYSRGINVICRYGGDEFIVLLVETSKDGARLYADRIRHVLSRHPFAHGRPLTASFGIASLPEDVTPAADDLIRAADEALYAAKRAGKNRVSVFEDTAPASLPGRAGGR